MSARDTERAPPAEDGFLARWSRRKQAAVAGEALPEVPPSAPAAPEAPAVQAGEPAPPAPLPDPETLDFADDFTAYLKERVPAAIKRAAMKKLFSDPSFNRMDGLDVYIEDFNRIGDLPAAEAGLLAHAREVLSPMPARRLSDPATAEAAVPPAAAQAGPAEAPGDAGPGADQAPAPGEAGTERSESAAEDGPGVPGAGCAKA